MDLWLRFLLDPGSLSASRSDLSPEKAGIALLLDGQLLQYARFANETELPPLVGPPISAATGADRVLLAAIVATLRGDVDATPWYESLLAEADQENSGRLAFTSVLASMNAADSEGSLAAVGILERFRPRSKSWAAVVNLHLGLRMAEIDRAGSALEATREAIRVIEMKGPKARLSRYLAWTAYSNEFHFAFMTGEIPAFGGANVRGSDAIADVDADLRQGLAAYLDGNYVESVKDIRTRSMTFNADDPITSRLDAALLRAECLADWQLLMNVRRWSGRWHLLNTLGRHELNPEVGFELLRRAQDNEGLELGLRHAQQVGPLRSVRNFGSRVAQSDWSDLERPTNLIVLRESADMLPQRIAEELVHRLTSNWAELSKPRRGAYVAHRVVDAVGSLLVAAGPRSNEDAAQFLFTLLPQEPGALGIQEIGRSLHQIDWSVVGQDVRNEWFDYTATHLGERTDAGVLAFDAAASIADADEARWVPLIQRRFRETERLDVAALLFGRSISVPGDIARECAAQTLASVDGIAENARQGSYGAGGRVQFPILLWQLHFDYPELVPWHRITDFLYESRVAADDKIPLVESLAGSVIRVLPEERADLAANTVKISTATSPFGDGSTRLLGAVFRLQLALGEIDGGEILSRILEWSGSSNALDRVEAASSVLFIDEAAFSDALTVLMLGLTLDANPVVRLQAAYGVGAKASYASPSLSPIVDDRLMGLLAESDSRVPLAVMNGLKVQIEQGSSVSTELLEQANRLSVEHLSALVRASAVSLQQAVDASVGGSDIRER